MDAEAVLRTIRSQKAEETRRQEQKRQQQAQERQRQARQSALAAQEKTRREVLEKREKELARIMEMKKETRQDEIQKRYDDALQNAADKLRDAQQRISETEKAIAALGFMQFMEKTRLKGVLREAQKEKDKAIRASADAETERRNALSSMSVYLTEEKKRQEEEMARLYPLPKRKYYGNTSYSENEGFKADIIDWMQPGKSYTIEEILEGVPSVVASGISGNRVTALLTQLREAGWITRTEELRRAFYSLKD